MMGRGLLPRQHRAGDGLGGLGIPAGAHFAFAAAARGNHEFRPEMHLVSLRKMVEEFKPRIVILDPIDPRRVGPDAESKAYLMRAIDF